MTETARRLPVEYSNANPRYIRWRPETARLIPCRCGKEFTAKIRLWQGNGYPIVCRQCGATLLVTHIRGFHEWLVAEVSAADLAHIEASNMVPECQLAYLLRTPIRAVRAEAR